MKILNKNIFPGVEVIFTEKAYSKILDLINATKLEIAWHGIVERDKDKNNIFTVVDILCYPQEGNGAHVESDDDKYHLWMSERTNEEINHLRLQGHSHVHMSVRPSPADEHNQKEIITQVKDFYIFMIINKSEELWINVVDIKGNVIYEETEIRTIIPEKPPTWGDLQVKEYLKDMKKTKTKYKVVSQTPPTLQTDEEVEEYIKSLDRRDARYLGQYGEKG